MGRLQRYVSNELTHFVGRHQSEEERYDLLIEIIKSGWILHKPFNPNISGNIMINIGAENLEEIVSPEITCYADIPIEDLSIHMDKYSRFGLAFKKEFLVSKGANPVFYIVQNGNERMIKNPDEIMNLISNRKGTEQFDTESFYKSSSREEWFKNNIIKYFEMMKNLRMVIRKNENSPGVPPEFHLLNELDGFLIKNIFAFLKPFDARKNDLDEDNYYLEREWRLVGNLNFEIQDIVRILIPEKYAQKLRNDLPQFYGQVTFTD